MANNENVVVEDLPSTNFLLNPRFFGLLNENHYEGYTVYNRVLENVDEPYRYELHLITRLESGEMFEWFTGKLTDKVTLLPNIKADVYLQTFITEYGFNVVESDSVDVLNIGDDDVTIYGWVILDPNNQFVLLYGLYDEALDVCGELFLDEGNTMQINIDTSCSEMIQ